MDGDKAGLGFDRASASTQGGGVERTNTIQKERKTRLSF